MLPIYPDYEPGRRSDDTYVGASDPVARKMRLFLMFLTLVGAFFVIAPEFDPTFQLFTPEGQRKGAILFLFTALIGWFICECDVNSREAASRPQKYKKPVEPDPFDTYIHE